MVEKLCAFKSKLTVFTTDLTATGLLHFPQLRAFMEMEMVDMQSSFALKQHLQSEGAENFWCNHVNQYQYPTTRKVSLLILTVFGSIYICETNFSHMNAIKTKARCSMTNEKLHECLRIAFTTYEPN